MFGRRSQHAVEGDEGEHSVRVFSYNELRKATQDFSGANKIGEGGFGSVFRVIMHRLLTASSLPEGQHYQTPFANISFCFTRECSKTAH